ncbi:MAG: AAC(3) family N-acetyltransferase [Bacteroidetes bacterium]|nr:AAC(3) family N-acetyltransferase [Bacteroidota bacterium]
MKKIYFFLKMFIPHSLLEKMRLYYYSMVRKRIPAISETEFKDILINRLGLKKGRDVFIHSSITLLKTEFSVARIIPVIREIVGEDATILFPSTHFSGRAEDYLKNKNSVFNVQTSHSVFGLLPELARREKDAVRSWHPTYPVVAIGKNAVAYIENQHKDKYPCGKLSPYYKLMERDALVIGIGVNSHYCTFVHCIEDSKEYKFPVETLLPDIFNARVQFPSKEIIIVETFAAHPRIKHRSVPVFFKKHIPEHIAKDININGVPYFFAKARELYYEMGKLAEKNITIYSKKAYK